MITIDVFDPFLTGTIFGGVVVLFFWAFTRWLDKDLPKWEHRVAKMWIDKYLDAALDEYKKGQEAEK